MKLLLIHNLEPEDVKFNIPLETAIANHASFDAVFYISIPPLELLEKDYGGVIISGVPVHYSIDTLDSRLEYFQWIRQTNIPVLGICLGHQNIGRLFGASMFVEEEAEDAHVPLHIKQAEDPILRDVLTGMTVRAYHGCSISVPEDFILLASTEKCRNHLMKHRQNDIYGAQFHPELSEGGGGLKIIENFTSIVKNRRIA
jgi:GMP synthase (glutamine-hydrolysing)